jgi:hypothetical protein
MVIFDYYPPLYKTKKIQNPFLREAAKKLNAPQD